MKIGLCVVDTHSEGNVENSVAKNGKKFPVF